jgi:hypothetical protein
MVLLGRKDEARSELESVLPSDENTSTCRLAHHYAGLLAVELGQPGVARRHFEDYLRESRVDRDQESLRRREQTRRMLDRLETPE